MNVCSSAERIVMRNKKFKEKNLTNNIIFTAVADDNLKILCRCMVVLHRNGIGKKRLLDMLNDYDNKVMPKYKQLSAEEIQHITVCREITAIGIEFDTIERAVKSLNLPHNSYFMRTLAENVGIFFIHLNATFGYGKTRLLRLLDEALKINGDAAVKEIEGIIGKPFDDSLVDVEEINGKPVKLHNDEIKQIQNDMAGLRALQERTYAG